MRRVTSDQTGVDEHGTITYEGVPFTGESICTGAGGRLEELVTYRDGREHGPWLEWYPDGTPRAQGECHHERGVVNLWREWHANGRISLEEVRTPEGHLATSREWDDAGSLIRDTFCAHSSGGAARVPGDDLEEGPDGVLVAGVPFTGEAFATDAAGMVVAFTCYVDGAVRGPRYTWHPNGVIRSEEHVRAGSAVSGRRRWGPDGVRVREEETAGPAAPDHG
ncbi:hypothetical protein BJF83_06520 [Nocardiopsis sp. CNR-923]|uniref:toxin-antitoxin system YwqK family antitoxin n=1 Tax=Nocardiopsis sp. CNR-923 TaxID=1904965 RepID=UPI00095B63DF|nr:hypothetical protein [Nocardiopsis sp. CNR-923]OLT24627.1 hypothetical protein BJF83_06520 [Nocardiopsis sp. CNR-923]